MPAAAAAAAGPATSQAGAVVGWWCRGGNEISRSFSQYGVVFTVHAYESIKTLSLIINRHLNIEPPTEIGPHVRYLRNLHSQLTELE